MSQKDTESLRVSAPCWSLAGDQQLLDLLQCIHQRILSKCQETNARLDEMVNSLDDASIHLQNVNNKFLALSNSQFIESRVYDDDADTADPTPAVDKTTNKPPAESNPSALVQSLRVLESHHEPVRFINDSDSDSDDDDVDCLVLKPKDQYSERPLPHIIGSIQWRNKWHAGVLKEESDSDSSASAHERSEAEQYSASDDETNIQTDERLPDHTISSSSGELSCDRQTDAVRPSPAEVAAELARRLGGQPPPVEVEYPKVEPIRKLYKPEAPLPSTVFPEEPPPLDNNEQTDDSSQDEYEDDIFAELHRSKPYHNSTKGQVATDLFAGLGYNATPKQDVDVIENTPQSTAAGKSTLFDEESEPELFVEKPPNVTKQSEPQHETTSKKPVGGISLFGSNKGAESIGAAILKRNQRKSSSESDNDTAQPNKSTPQTKNPIQTAIVKTDGEISNVGNKNINSQVQNIDDNVKKSEKDIFNDLFAKKEVTNKNKNVKNVVNDSPKVETKENKKVNLFDDSLFDDIDDIFATNIVSKVPVKEIKKVENQSIFDDDDLFADKAVAKPVKHDSKNVRHDISKESHSSKIAEIKNDAKSIFDSDENIFASSNVKIKPDSKVENPILSKPDSDLKNKVNVVEKSNIFGDEDEIFTNKTVQVSKETNNVATASKDYLLESNIENKQLQSPSLFDDDDDALFNETVVQKNLDKNESKVSDENRSESYSSEVFTKEVEDGLVSSNTVDVMSKANHKTNAVKSISQESVEDKQDVTVKSDKKTNLINRNKEEIDYRDINDVSTPPPLSNDDFKPYSNSNTSQNNVPESPEIDFSDNVIVEKPSLFSNSPPPLPRADVFAEIFSEPPDFEKPAEPKKSKNVNALFDDDSDDEALFFKKSDATLDEKPVAFTNTKQDHIFGLFHDEPPAIDVDFEQKSTKKTENILDDIQDELFQHKTNKSPSKTAGEDITDMPQSPQTEVKKIGKLKPSTLNINVHSLLPGVSPKKTQKYTEQTDGSIISTQIENASEIESNDKTIKSTTKTVNFDENPESGVLDNKLSKGRAKIQVKRRPSTRRARKEAVRKSGIDFGEDSTDNSSSIDDPPKTVTNTDPVTNSETTTQSYRPKDVKSKIVYILNDEDIFTDAKPVATPKESLTDTFSKVVAKPKLNILDDDDLFQSKKETNVTTLGQVYSNETKKSKLDSSFDLSDDDDIFKDKPSKNGSSSQSEVVVKESEIEEIIQKEATKQDVRLENSLDLSDDSDSIFKESKTDSKNKPKEKSKKGTFKSEEVTQKAVSNVRKSSIFDDMSDDGGELFSKTKNNKKVDVKTSIFDSDSDDDMFGSKKRTDKDLKEKDKLRKETDMRTRETVKGSLFGDDDNDDLFGATSKKSETKPAASASSSQHTVKESAKTDEVFEDPLSMFSD